MSEISQVFDTLDYGPAPESAQFANEWLEKHDRCFGHFIGGAWTDPSIGETAKVIEIKNPATGEVIAKVRQGGVEHVGAAVTAARAAQPGWWQLGSHGRARCLYAIARKIQKHARLLAVLETMDSGKPIRESRDLDIPLVARHFYHHAGWAQLMQDDLPDYEPLGVPSLPATTRPSRGNGCPARYNVIRKQM